jgi:hypothetical protein
VVKRFSASRAGLGLAALKDFGGNGAVLGPGVAGQVYSGSECESQ